MAEKRENKKNALITVVQSDISSRKEHFLADSANNYNLTSINQNRQTNWFLNRSFCLLNWATRCIDELRFCPVHQNLYPNSERVNLFMNDINEWKIKNSSFTKRLYIVCAFSYELRNGEVQRKTLCWSILAN